MLTQVPNPEGSSRNLRAERHLLHDGQRHTVSLGCTKCPQKDLCGGLQISRALFDCLGFCCRHPADCDIVCRNKPDGFAHRVREVGGFIFDNVPRASVLAGSPLPLLVPVVYHGSGRLAPFLAPAVCLPLYKVIERHSGEIRYTTATDLARGFAIMPGLPIILTGTARDGPLERWWSLGAERRDAIRRLRGLGIALVTTPNYSLFTDQPRWDDLYSMKRIAIAHEEFLSEGLPAALHVNARTERDWERWTNYIVARPEVTHIAFEFATGAGRVNRIEWHADQLVKLAAAVERPLHLIVRGGAKLLPLLAAMFSGVTLLETSVFMKTKSRQRAVLLESGKVAWQSSPTETSETIDTLLAENWKVIAASHASVVGRELLPSQGAE